MYTNQPSLYVLHSLPSLPSSPSSWSALAVSSFLLIWNPRTIPSFSNHSYQLPIITNPIQYSYRHRHHCCFWRKHVWLLKSAKGGNTWSCALSFGAAFSSKWKIYKYQFESNIIWHFVVCCDLFQGSTCTVAGIGQFLHYADPSMQIMQIHPAIICTAEPSPFLPLT